MLDKDIREPLFDFLEDYYGKIRMIEEKNISDSRADALGIVDGRILGFEIKSDSDSYTRLKTQIKDYEKFCDECYIVVGESHRAHVAEHVPEYWGIMVVSEYDVFIERDPMPNPGVSLMKQLDLLWRPELAHIQEKEAVPKYGNKRRAYIYDKLIEKVGAEGLKHDITDELFERDYTVYDAINSSKYVVRAARKPRRRRKRSSRKNT